MSGYVTCTPVDPVCSSDLCDVRRVMGAVNICVCCVTCVCGVCVCQVWACGIWYIRYTYVG